jgi:predicted cupin superfamily sugar epimerase
MTPRTAEEWANALDLLPHPEGGWYRETWRAKETIPHGALPSGFKGDRSAGTSIYFLLRGGMPSRFHRIASDEIWHWYQGAPLAVHVLGDDGICHELNLGPDPSAGQSFQEVVPAGAWFGAESRGEWTLCGCTVSPGFDFADFELGGREALLARFPTHRELVERLT